MFSFFKPNNKTKEWKNYLDSFSNNKKNLSTRFIILDTETTGFKPTDRILSIGCIAINNLQIEVKDSIELYLNQPIFSKETVPVHGILKNDNYSLAKLSEQEAIAIFLNYIKDAIIIAHHADFDIKMLNTMLHRNNYPKLKNKVLDTAILFQKLKASENTKQFTLDNLANHFKIPLHDRHTASGDAFITALLFLKILKKLQQERKSLVLTDLFFKRKIGLL